MESKKAETPKTQNPKTGNRQLETGNSQPGTPKPRLSRFKTLIERLSFMGKKGPKNYFDRFISLSSVEGPKYDYKQGFLSLGEDRTLNPEHFKEKIIRSIAALANRGKKKKGFLFVGVSDDEDTAKRIMEMDGLKECPKVNGFHVVGIEREARVLGVDLDEYLLRIASIIRRSELPDSLKAQVVTGMQTINHEGLEILVIKVEGGNMPVWFEGAIYYRVGPSCQRAEPGEEINEIYRRFF